MNWKLFSSVCSVCVGLAMGLTALPSYANKDLNGSQIKKIMPGSYVLVVYNSISVEVNATNGGSLRVTVMGDIMKGKWSVSGDKLCITLNDGKESKSKCSNVKYDGKKYYSIAGAKFSK